MVLEFKKTLKSAAGRAAEAAGFMTRRPRNAMTIVTFHRINDELPEDGLTCCSRKFTAFCRFFLKYFRVVSLAEQIEGCRIGRDMGGTLSITFDDGYSDNFTVAAPILTAMAIPATFFVTTGFIDSSVVPAWDDRLRVPQHWMSWAQVRQLVAQGFDIGSHTDGHINLSTSDPAAIRTDLEASRAKLQRELGESPRLFAYPFGREEDISDTARELVRRTGFECCLSCFGGVNLRNADPYHLRRISIGEWFASPHQFALEFILGRL